MSSHYLEEKDDNEKTLQVKRLKAINHWCEMTQDQRIEMLNTSEYHGKYPLLATLCKDEQLPYSELPADTRNDLAQLAEKGYVIPKSKPSHSAYFYKC